MFSSGVLRYFEGVLRFFPSENVEIVFLIMFCGVLRYLFRCF